MSWTGSWNEWPCSGLSCRHGQDQQRPHPAAAQRLLPGPGLRRNRPGHRQGTPLRQTCPDEAAAAAALGRLLAEADGGRFPDRQATLGQALDKYLEVADLEVSTREAHEGYIRRTIGPVLGEVKIRKLGADSLDCSVHGAEEVLAAVRRLPRTEHHADGEHACDQRCGPLRDHRTTRPHACDSRCRPHACRPMKPGDDPADPLDHLLGPGPGRPLRLGGPQRRQERQPAASRASASRTRPARTRPPGCSTSSGPRTRSSACTCGPRSRPGPAAAR